MAERVNNRLTREITVLDWVGRLYTAIYSPIVQTLWLAENWSASGGALKILSLTIDVKNGTRG